MATTPADKLYEQCDRKPSIYQLLLKRSPALVLLPNEGQGLGFLLWRQRGELIANHAPMLLFQPER